jgi:hypothetical protein
MPQNLRCENGWLCKEVPNGGRQSHNRTPKSLTCESAVSRESVRITLTMAALNDLEVCQHCECMSDCTSL